MSTHDKGVSLSVNRSLNFLKSTIARNSFRAVVADDGTGHYSSISDAVDAGEKYIFLKDGSYSESADITLEGVTIVGQSAQGVILTLTDATILMADNNSSTSAGSVKPTYNVKTVVGAGTSFTSVSSDSNKYLFADMFLSEIDSISDNTNMELFAKYFGPSTDQTGADLSLSHDTFSTSSFGSSISNLTIIHVLTGSDTCIELQGIRNSISNVHFKNSNNSSTFISSPRSASEIAVYCMIERCRFEGGTIGIKLFSSKFCTIKECTFFGFDDNCIELTVDAFATSIYNCSFTGSVRGINLSGVAMCTLIDNCYFAFTSFEAIIFDRNGETLLLTISNNEFRHCYPTSRTIFLDGDFVKIIGNTFSGGTNVIYVENAADVHIKDNYFFNWETRAIDFNSFRSQSRITISGNNFIAESAGSVTESGLNIYGDHHVISNNQFKYIEEEALDVQSRNTVVSGNSFDNCGDKNLIVEGNYNNVSSNNFETCTNAIVVTGDENIITGNLVKDDGGTALLVNTGDRNIISCNRIHNPTTNGIELDSNADKNVLTSNIALDATGTNILNNGTNTSVGNNIDS